MSKSSVGKVRLPMALLAKLLHLPAGVEVASIRETDTGDADITIVDPERKIIEGSVYNEVTKRWSKKPAETKGSTRGRSRRSSTHPLNAVDLQAAAS